MIKSVLRGVVYRLKHRFGVRVVYRQFISEDANVQTGQRTLNYADYTLSKVPVMEARAIRDFEYDLSYIASNKNFTYGGVINRKTRFIILDAKDYSFPPDKLDLVNYNDEDYQVKEIYEMYHSLGYVIMITQAESR